MKVFRKNVMSCWECPGRDPMMFEMKDGIICSEGFCREFQHGIPIEFLKVETRFNKFPPFCKLKEAR